MSKLIRKLMAQELCQKLEKMNSFVVFSYSSMTGEQNHLFRGKLRSQEIRVKMMPNTLTGLAIEQTFHRDMKKMLHGPCAIAYGGQSPVDLAKALLDISKKTKLIKIVGGYLDGLVLNDKQVDELSKTPPKKVLLASLAGALDTPFQDILGSLNGAVQGLSNAFNGLVMKLEKN